MLRKHPGLEENAKTAKNTRGEQRVDRRRKLTPEPKGRFWPLSLPGEI